MTEACTPPGVGAAGGPTILQALRLCGLPFREARRLLANLLDVSDTWLLAHDDQTLSSGQAAHFFALAERRRAGEPLAYVLGWREFYGHRLRVTPAVLIPRPETELLVETALAAMPLPRAGEPAPRWVDLGTGSGAIAIALALSRPDIQVWATDLSPEALAVAQQNAQHLHAPRVRFARGTWWDALASLPELAGTRFDGAVSNPPYIAAGDAHLHQGDLPYEPLSALTDHGDGLQHVRQLIAGAAAWLKPGACLWLEHGYDQAAAVRRLFVQAGGWASPESRRDLAGIERVTGACWLA